MHPIRSLCKLISPAIFAVLALCVAAPAQGQSVSISTSDHRTWVGIPIQVNFHIQNAKEIGEPELPTVEGLTIESSGSTMQSQSIRIVDGVRTESRTVNLQIIVTPHHAGEFVLPPITITIDGKQYTSEPMDLESVKSEVGDRLFVEIVNEGGEAWVGQQLRPTLRIWVKPYYSEEFDFEVSGSTMWRLIDKERSDFGPFVEPLQLLARRRKQPTMQVRQRAEGEYYLYELTCELRPTGLDSLDELKDVAVAMSYPQSLQQDRRRRGFEFGSLMPIRVAATVEPMHVNPLPETNRPADFRGAVGDFVVRAGARPTNIAVGDPITFTVLISSIDGDQAVMTTLRPPPLAELDVLTTDFRVPSDPLAGEVNGAAKFFNQTIRPRNDVVSEIPPIPFSFFNPKTGTYETVYTPAIPIQVSPAEQLAASDIVRADGSLASTVPIDDSPDDSNDDAGMRANFPVDDNLLQHTTHTVGPATYGMLVAPPAFVALAFLIATRRRTKQKHPARTRALRARARAIAALRTASTASDVGDTLRQFISERTGRAATSLTATEAITLARSVGAPDAAIDQLASFLREAERAGFSGNLLDSQQVDVTAARELIRTLDRGNWPTPVEQVLAGDHA